jgi:hypothetical protein
MSNTQLMFLVLLEVPDVYSDATMTSYQTVQLMRCIPPSNITGPVRQRDRCAIESLQRTLRDAKVESTGQLIPCVINIWTWIAAVGGLMVHRGIDNLILPLHYGSRCRWLA